MPVWTDLHRSNQSIAHCRSCGRSLIVLDNVGTDGSLEDIGEGVASLAGLAFGGDDGNRGSAGHFGGRGLFVAVVDSEGEDSKIEDFANVGGATRLAQPEILAPCGWS